MTPEVRKLDRDRLLSAETFWTNRDWQWYKDNIPFFECPDSGITTTYYYRWELITRHATYGSPRTGYVFTEFIDRPFWSGRYGAISCPAGHQLYEVRWARNPRYARDYIRYWFRTSGAQPRRYSTWLADAAWAVHLVHPSEDLLRNLLPDMIANFRAWEKERFNPEVGLFWQTGHDDGMELNINSRQTSDPVRGAPGYRPTLNSYMYADALAIARVAELAGDVDTASVFRAKAKSLKENVQKKLWDPQREFFFHLAARDESHEGFTVKALTWTYRTGRFAGNPHGRELIGYVPWQFRLPDLGYEAAWKFLMDENYFAAPFGPTTVERRDPLFYLSKTCCYWSGQSWPYATTQTLQAMANLLRHYDQQFVTPEDYYRLLRTYALTHRKNGRPYIAEACHPFTGSWEGHDSYYHSEHYFHSGFIDLVITGLCGLLPQPDQSLIVAPLAPVSWDYFALDYVPYKGSTVGIFWDKGGNRYGFGPGLTVIVDGKLVAARRDLGELRIKLPRKNEASERCEEDVELVNWAVNNDGTYYPKITASYVRSGESPYRLVDGNYWYDTSPPNRWTCVGSPNKEDWVEIDFGRERIMQEVTLYILDDGAVVRAPEKVEIAAYIGGRWEALRSVHWEVGRPIGRQANRARFRPLTAQKLRIQFTHTPGSYTGLTEVEVWGSSDGKIEDAERPQDLIALSARKAGHPAVRVSFTSPYDRAQMACDGVVQFLPQPPNRWTSFQSANREDWLEIDWGASTRIGRLELAIYDDGGGVQAPADYRVEIWHQGAWQPAQEQRKTPTIPVGGVWNQVVFRPVATDRIRIVFTHRGPARSGVSEVLAWPE